MQARSFASGVSCGTHVRIVCVGHRSGDVVVHALNMIILLGFIIWKYHVSLYAALSHQCLPPHRFQHHWGGCGGGGGRLLQSARSLFYVGLMLSTLSQCGK